MPGKKRAGRAKMRRHKNKPINLKTDKTRLETMSRTQNQTFLYRAAAANVAPVEYKPATGETDRASAKAARFVISSSGFHKELTSIVQAGRLMFRIQSKLAKSGANGAVKFPNHLYNGQPLVISKKVFRTIKTAYFHRMIKRLALFYKAALAARQFKRAIPDASGNFAVEMRNGRQDLVIKRRANAAGTQPRAFDQGLINFLMSNLQGGVSAAAVFENNMVSTQVAVTAALRLHLLATRAYHWQVRASKSNANNKVLYYDLTALSNASPVIAAAIAEINQAAMAAGKRPINASRAVTTDLSRLVARFALKPSDEQKAALAAYNGHDFGQAGVKAAIDALHAQDPEWMAKNEKKRK